MLCLVQRLTEQPLNGGRASLVWSHELHLFWYYFSWKKILWDCGCWYKPVLVKMNSQKMLICVRVYHCKKMDTCGQRSISWRSISWWWWEVEETRAPWKGFCNTDNVNWSWMRTNFCWAHTRYLKLDLWIMVFIYSCQTMGFALLLKQLYSKGIQVCQDVEKECDMGRWVMEDSLNR